MLGLPNDPFLFLCYKYTQNIYRLFDFILVILKLELGSWFFSTNEFFNHIMQDAWIHHKNLVRLEASIENILNHSRGTTDQMRDIP